MPALTHAEQHVINLTLGPMQIGNFLNSILLGVLLLQVGQYYTNFRDPLWIRLLVALTVTIDVTQSALMMYMTWEYAVAHFGNMDFVAKSNWALSSIPFFSVPVSWIVQGFYAWRIRTLTKRWHWTALVVLFAAVQGAFGIWAGVGSFRDDSTSDNEKLQKIAIVWFVFAMCCDIVIMFVMIWSLSQAKTGFRDTDTLITKINRTVIETGMSTTLTVLLDCLFLFLIPGTDMHLVPVMAVGKVYSNSFMYLLNSRGSYRKVSSLRTADFVATLDRSSGHDRDSGPRKPAHRLSELQFAPNAAIQRGEQTEGSVETTGVYVSRDTYVMSSMAADYEENPSGKGEYVLPDLPDDDGPPRRNEHKSNIPHFP